MIIKVKWLLENDVFSEDLQPLKNEIVKQGYEYKDAKYKPFVSDSYNDFFSKDDCVIFYGSLNLALQLQREKLGYNIYCTRQNYECWKYYAYFGKWLLNQNYVMLPYSELYRRKKWLYDILGQDGAIFIRPSSGAKIFTGKLVYEENFDKDYELLGLYDVEPHVIVVVAEPRNIIKEWRLVIADKKIIAGSLYNDLTLNLRYEGFPSEVEEYANNILKETTYIPDSVWTMDICQTKSGSFYLLEINSFSCSGLYECNLEPIVREVSSISLKKFMIGESNV